MSNPTLNSDYSPSATLIHFPTPIPLLRHPTPVSPPDDPTLGPFILAFPTPHSFLTSLSLSHSHILHHCHSATRFACSLTASQNCQPPWWQFTKKPDFKQRQQCEEREMEACLAKSEGKCEEFAKDKVLGPFGWARVGLKERRVRKKEAGKLVSWVLGLGFLKRDLGFKVLVGGELKELSLWYDVNYVRGCELLDDDNLPF